MRWLIGLLSLGVFSQAQSRRAAILLTGHVRTFDLTAPTLDEFLIKANPTYTFSVFCSTYQEREAHAIDATVLRRGAARPLDPTGRRWTALVKKRRDRAVR